MFAPSPRPSRGRTRAQIFDDDLWMDLFLDVNRHGGDFEWTGVLFVLALPDQLRVKRRVARVKNGLGLFLVVGHEVAQFLGGDVGALILMLGGEDGRGGFGVWAWRIRIFLVRLVCQIVRAFLPDCVRGKGSFQLGEANFAPAFVLRVRGGRCRPTVPPSRAACLLRNNPAQSRVRVIFSSERLRRAWRR